MAKAKTSGYVRVRDCDDEEWGLPHECDADYHHQSEPIARDEITIEGICELLSHEAESENYHGLVGIPAFVAATIENHVEDLAVVRDIMLDICDNDGFMPQ